MEAIKNKIRNWLLKHLLNAITETDFVTLDERNQIVYINGVPISTEEHESIKEEAKFIEKTRLWALMQGTLASQARQSIFDKSVKIEDIMWGKSMLYNLDVQNKIIRILKK